MAYNLRQSHNTSWMAIHTLWLLLGYILQLYIPTTGRVYNDTWDTVHIPGHSWDTTTHIPLLTEYLWILCPSQDTTWIYTLQHITGSVCTSQDIPGILLLTEYPQTPGIYSVHPRISLQYIPTTEYFAHPRILLGYYTYTYRNTWDTLSIPGYHCSISP